MSYIDNNIIGILGSPSGRSLIAAMEDSRTISDRIRGIKESVDNLHGRSMQVILATYDIDLNFILRHDHVITWLGRSSVPTEYIRPSHKYMWRDGASYADHRRVDRDLLMRLVEHDIITIVGAENISDMHIELILYLMKNVAGPYSKIQHTIRSKLSGPSSIASAMINTFSEILSMRANGKVDENIRSSIIEDRVLNDGFNYIQHCVRVDEMLESLKDLNILKPSAENRRRSSSDIIEYLNSIFDYFVKNTNMKRKGKDESCRRLRSELLREVFIDIIEEFCSGSNQDHLLELWDDRSQRTSEGPHGYQKLLMVYTNPTSVPKYVDHDGCIFEDSLPSPYSKDINKKNFITVKNSTTFADSGIISTLLRSECICEFKSSHMNIQKHSRRRTKPPNTTICVCPL